MVEIPQELLDGFSDFYAEAVQAAWEDYQLRLPSAPTDKLSQGAFLGGFALGYELGCDLKNARETNDGIA